MIKTLCLCDKCGCEIVRKETPAGTSHFAHFYVPPWKDSHLGLQPFQRDSLDLCPICSEALSLTLNLWFADRSGLGDLDLLWNLVMRPGPEHQEHIPLPISINHAHILMLRRLLDIFDLQGKKTQDRLAHQAMQFANLWSVRPGINPADETPGFWVFFGDTPAQFYAEETEALRYYDTMFNVASRFTPAQGGETVASALRAMSIRSPWRCHRFAPLGRVREIKEGEK